MKRVLMGLVVGLLLGATAQGDERQREERLEKLEDTVIGTVSGGSFAIPERYGRLVNIVINAEVHYLDFEDSAGTIRVVLIGPRGAVQRSRSPLQLLSTEASVIKRGRDNAS